MRWESRAKAALALARWTGGLVLCVLLLVAEAAADELPPLGTALVGGEFSYVVRRSDSLRSIGSRYGVEPTALAAVNGFAASARLRVGRTLRIDNRHVVPRAVARGILINIPQRYLFLFRGGKADVACPVGLGRPSWRTVTGKFTVIGKRTDPVWTVPESIQREMKREGKEVRSCVPPGTGNPLGSYALDLSIASYLIHGTIAPSSIYAFQTHGCIRLHPDDIAALFGRVEVGEPGEIIYQPVLLARLDNGRIFLEVNRDIYRKAGDAMLLVRAWAETSGLDGEIDWRQATAVIERREGVAREVDRAGGRLSLWRH